MILQSYAPTAVGCAGNRSPRAAIAENGSGKRGSSGVALYRLRRMKARIEGRSCTRSASRRKMDARDASWYETALPRATSAAQPLRS